MMRRLATVVDEASRPARMRYAGDVFNTGRGRLRDRLVSSAYFAVSTPYWGSLAIDDAHLAAFVAGLERIDIVPRTVVDVGTGGGASAALSAQRWPRARVEGIDASVRMVRRARRTQAAANLTFRRASALAMPYPPGSVDLVTCLNAIVVPSELRRVCAPGGRVLLAATWVPLRGEDSDWVRRFTGAGFERLAADNCGKGAWELFAFRGR